jgi:predicted DNA-binding protein
MSTRQTGRAERPTKDEILTVRMDRELLARLRAVQDRVGIPVAEQVRRAVQAYLPQHEGRRR